MSAVEWRRLKPSGYVHGWDSVTPRRYALCGVSNVYGTTDDFPLMCKRCGTCVLRALATDEAPQP